MSVKRDGKGEPTAIAGRLNRAVQDVRAPDVKAFHATLAEGAGDDFPSYAAALTYHGKPFRMPPVSYLARISEVYDIRLDWLIHGSGEPFGSRAYMEDNERRAAAEEAFAECVPGWDNLIPAARAAMHAASDRLLWRACTEVGFKPGVYDEVPGREDFATLLGRMAVGGLEQVGIRRDELGDRASEYVMSFAQAFLIASDARVFRTGSEQRKKKFLRRYKGIREKARQLRKSATQTVEED
jgi:hypothetical protein